MSGDNETDETRNGGSERHPAWRKRFLQALANYGTVSDACRAAGIARATAYRLQKADESFAQEWEEACEVLTDELEQTAIRRAIDGWDEPVFQKGEEVGVKRKFDNGLLWRLLRSRRRAVYNPKVGDAGSSGGEVEDVATRIREALKAMRASVPTEPPSTPPAKDQGTSA